MLDQIEKLNWLSHLYFVKNDYENCKKIYLLAPSDYNNYLLSLISLNEDGDVKKSLNYINSIYSENQILYCKSKAKCLLLVGKHDELIELIKENYIEKFSFDWQLWQMLGICYFYTSNIKMAVDAFQNAMQTSIKFDPYLYLSECHVLEKDIKSAVSVLKKADEIWPNNTRIKIKLGILLYTNNMKSRGIEKLMELYNKSATTLGDLKLSLAVGSIIQENQCDIDNALLRYKLANKFESPVLCNNVALCFIEKKKMIAAVSCLKRSLYLNVFDWRTNYNLGLLYLQMKQYASAFHYLKNSVTLSGGKKYILSLLAICLENLDDHFNSKNANEKAIKNEDCEYSLLFSLINYCVYLYNNNHIENKNKIIQLLIKFEENWIKNKNNLSETSQTIINTANILCSKLNYELQLGRDKNKEKNTTVI